MIGKIKQAEKVRDERLEGISRKKAWHEHTVEVALHKEQDDARDWMKQEAKRMKENYQAKICEDIDSLKREMNVWDGPEVTHHPPHARSASHPPSPPPPPLPMRTRSAKWLQKR